MRAVVADLPRNTWTYRTLRPVLQAVGNEQPTTGDDMSGQDDSYVEDVLDLRLLTAEYKGPDLINLPVRDRRRQGNSRRVRGLVHRTETVHEGCPRLRPDCSSPSKAVAMGHACQDRLALGPWSVPLLMASSRRSCRPGNHAAPAAQLRQRHPRLRSQPAASSAMVAMDVSNSEQWFCRSSPPPGTTTGARSTPEAGGCRGG